MNTHRIHVLTLAMLAVVVTTGMLQPANAQVVARIVDPGTKARGAPTAEAPLVDLLDQGVVFPVVDQSVEGWLRLQRAADQVWVRAADVRVSVAPLGPAASAEAMPTAEEGQDSTTILIIIGGLAFAFLALFGFAYRSEIVHEHRMRHHEGK